MTRTAYAMAALSEIGIALGHSVDISRPAGDAVTRYGMGPSFVRAPVAARRGRLRGRLRAGRVADALRPRADSSRPPRGARGGPPRPRVSGPRRRRPPRGARDGARLAPVGIRGVRLVRAAAGRLRRRRVRVRGARRPDGRAAARPPRGRRPERSRRSRFSRSPSSSSSCRSSSSSSSSRRRATAARVRALAFLGGASPFAALWLAFEIVRFGRPFASYVGEPFSHPARWPLAPHGGPEQGALPLLPARAPRRLGPRPARAGTAGSRARPRRLRCVPPADDGRVVVVGRHVGLGAATSRAARSAPRGCGRRRAAGGPRRPSRSSSGLGVAVNALGVLQPDGAYDLVLHGPSPEGAHRGRDARLRVRIRPVSATAGDAPRLGQWFDVANHAALSPLKVSAWLLARGSRGATFSPR